MQGMSEETKRLREQFGVAEHCHKCINCGLCIKSKQYEELKKKGTD